MHGAVALLKVLGNRPTTTAGCASEISLQVYRFGSARRDTRPLVAVSIPRVSCENVPTPRTMAVPTRVHSTRLRQSRLINPPGAIRASKLPATALLDRALGSVREFSSLDYSDEPINDATAATRGE